MAHATRPTMMEIRAREESARERMIRFRRATASCSISASIGVASTSTDERAGSASTIAAGADSDEASRPVVTASSEQKSDDARFTV
jgi:hypothetical protein